MNEAPLPAFLSGYPEPFTDADLDFHTDPSNAPAKIPWKPEDDAAADWAMRKLAETVFAARPIEEQAEAWRERINDWERTQMKPLQRRVEFFQGLLMAYGLEQRANGRKTVRLPAGTISTRGSEDERLVISEVEFLKCMATAPPLIREALTLTKPRPVSELRLLVHRYRRIACPQCGEVSVRSEMEPDVCACGGEADVLETFVGIPTFGLADEETMATGVFRVEGAEFEAPAQPTASVALADERALPRPG